MNRSALVAGMTAAACALLAACSTPAGQQPPGGAASSSPATIATAPITPPVVTTAPGTTPPASQTTGQPILGPAGPPCSALNLTVAKSTAEGAAGTLVQRFIITNAGTGPCDMSGSPVISPYGLVTQGGIKVEATLDVTVTPVPSDFGDIGAIGGPIGLGPGDTAVFYFVWSQVPVGNAKCPQADGFNFRPPQDPSSGDQKLITFPFTPCGSALHVSQVLPPSIGG